MRAAVGFVGDGELLSAVVVEIVLRVDDASPALSYGEGGRARRRPSFLLGLRGLTGGRQRG